MSGGSGLGGWLRRYKPATVRLHLREGGVKDIQRPQHGRKWIIVESAIENYDVVLVEAIGEDGKTVISSRTMEAAEDPAETPQAVGAQETPYTPLPVVDPTAAAVIAVIERSMSVMLGVLLPKIVQLNVEASEAATARQAEAWMAGNAQQLELIRMLYTRMNSLEAAWDVVRMERMQQAGAASEDQNDAIVRGIVERWTGAPTTPKPNGTPNGSSTGASGGGSPAASGGNGGQ